MKPKSNTEVIYRHVGLDCIDDLLALENSCFNYDRCNRRNMRYLLRSPSVFCMGAYRGNELIGSLVLLFKRNTRSMRIYSLAVAESARGLGIGRCLVKHAEQEALRRKCVRVRLEVRMDNTPALHLYQSMGYTDTAVRPGYYEDGTHAFVMRKELN